MSRTAHLLRETKQRDVWNPKSDPFGKTYYRHGHITLTRTVANGLGTSSEHILNRRPAEKKQEPLLRIREKINFSLILQKHLW